MTLHVCILGIDGSGKSTVSAALPAALAADVRIVTGAAGEQFRVVAPEDLTEVSPSGLVSAMGGKLTTARIMAVRVLDQVIEALGDEFPACRTHRLSIGGTNEAVVEGMAHWVRRYPRLAWYFRVLFGRYGLDAHEICAEAMEIHGSRYPGADPLRAEVEYVCRNEMVCTVEDLLERRAGFLYWDSEKRLERLRYGGPVVRAELGLTEEEFRRQISDYKEHLARFHSLPGDGL